MASSLCPVVGVGSAGGAAACGGRSQYCGGGVNIASLGRLQGYNGGAATLLAGKAG